MKLWWDKLENMAGFYNHIIYELPGINVLDEKIW